MGRARSRYAKMDRWKIMEFPAASSHIGKWRGREVVVDSYRRFEDREARHQKVGEPVTRIKIWTARALMATDTSPMD